MCKRWKYQTKTKTICKVLIAMAFVLPCTKDIVAIKISFTLITSIYNFTCIYHIHSLNFIQSLFSLSLHTRAIPL
jgi:hypothetical protein